MRLLQVAWAASWIEDYLVPIAMSVYAYGRGGAAAAGLAGVARIIPSTVAAPALGVFVDRWPRERVLVLSFAVQAGACAAMAVAFSVSAPLSVLLILLGVEGFVSVLITPATGALLPWLAGSPADLTAGNAALSMGRAVGLFLGPLLAGVLIATVDAGAAFVAGGMLMGLSTILSIRLRVPRGPGSSGAAGGGGAKVFARDMAVGFHVLASDRVAGSIALLLASVQGLLRGLFTVLNVVVAVRLLGLGGSGAGYLQAAAGLGGVIAGVALLAASDLTGRLGDSFAFGIVLRTVPFVLLAAAPYAAPALALMLVTGVGSAVMTSGGYALIQRLVPNASVGRVLTATGMLTTLGVAGGSVLAAPLLSAVGVHAVLVAVGVAWPVAALAVWPLAREAERRGAANDAEIELLRKVPFMKLLPLVALEACAEYVRRLQVRRGEVIVRKGEIGDRFYVIASGSAAVELDGCTIERLGDGGWFGEVALLRTSARIATVRMTSDGEVASLDRHHFLRALALDGSAELAAISSIQGLPGIERAAPRAPVDERMSLADSETLTVLRSVPLLEHASEPILEELRARASRMQVAAGDEVFHEGDPGAVFFVVLAGTLVVNIGGEDVYDIGPGDWFGELGLLRGRNRTATVRASTAAILLSVPGDSFLIAVGESPTAPARSGPATESDLQSPKWRA